MNLEAVLQKMLSRKSDAMWEGSWEILRCNEPEQLTQILPHIPAIEAAMEKTRMRGTVISHRSSVRLALRYVVERSRGSCRCILYGEESYISPTQERERGYLRIKETQIVQARQEQQFWIMCNGCGMEFRVVEMIGGHVARYQWREALP